MEKFKKLSRDEMRHVNGAGPGPPPVCKAGNFCNVVSGGINYPGNCDPNCWCITTGPSAQICTNG